MRRRKQRNVYAGVAARVDSGSRSPSPPRSPPGSARGAQQGDSGAVVGSGSLTPTRAWQSQPHLAAQQQQQPPAGSGVGVAVGPRASASSATLTRSESHRPAAVLRPSSSAAAGMQSPRRPVSMVSSSGGAAGAAGQASPRQHLVSPNTSRRSLLLSQAKARVPSSHVQSLPRQQQHQQQQSSAPAARPPSQPSSGSWVADSASTPSGAVPGPPQSVSLQQSPQKPFVRPVAGASGRKPAGGSRSAAKHAQRPSSDDIEQLRVLIDRVESNRGESQAGAASVDV